MPTQLTDQTGNAVFQNISAGAHSVKVVKGSLSASEKITVDATHTDFTVVLKEGVNWIPLVVGGGLVAAGILALAIIGRREK